MKAQWAQTCIYIFRGLLHEDAFRRGPGALLRMPGLRSLAVRTKPSSVGWTETANEIRWCVQTLFSHDWICSLPVGRRWKIQQGPIRETSLNSSHAPLLHRSSFVCFFFSWRRRHLRPGRECFWSLTVTHRGLGALLCPHGLVFKMLLGPEDGSNVSSSRYIRIILASNFFSKYTGSEKLNKNTAKTSRQGSFPWTRWLTRLFMRYYSLQQSAARRMRSVYFYVTCDLWLRWFPFRETLRWSSCESSFFHAYFWSSQLCWTEIGSWAFSSCEQEVGAGRHRAGWLPLPDDSPGGLPSV